MTVVTTGPSTKRTLSITSASKPRELVLAPSGHLNQFDVGALLLESGETLPEVQLGFETFGTLNDARDNAVLVHHALTGSTHVSRGNSSEDGWWEGLVGPGCVIDTDQFFVVAINLVGGCYGSTGPASLAEDGRPWGSRFPFITLRDSVRAEARLSDALGIHSWRAVVGGSMGGARALEWAVTFPERVRTAVVIASCAASSAEQIALAQAQVEAIKLDSEYLDGDYYGRGFPDRGLGLARRIAHLSYRSESELAGRFGRTPQGQELPVSAGRLRSPKTHRYAVESYLDYQAHKLVQRFDANSYIVLTEALMSHDVTRSRGALRHALEAAGNVDFVLAAVRSDRLYLPEQTAEIASALDAEVPVHWIESEIGHDGFLTEIEQLTELLSKVFPSSN